MRRSVAVLAATVAFVGGQSIYQANGPCAEWRDRYRDFMVGAVLRQAPGVSQVELDRAVGERPFSCPTPTLRDWSDDLARYKVPWEKG